VGDRLDGWCCLRCVVVVGVLGDCLCWLVWCFLLVLSVFVFILVCDVGGLGVVFLGGI